VSGAAISSVIVQIITAVSITAYAIRKLPEYKLLTRFFRFDKVAFVKVGTLGLPIGTSIVAETGLFTASSIMMGWFGAITLAAHGIALQIASVMFMIHLGLAEASTIKAGNAWGSRNLLLLKKGAKVAASCSILFSLAAMTVLITFGDTLVSIYVDIDDPSRTQIIYTGALLLVAAALFQFVDGGQAMALGLLRGIQDTTVPMLITILSYWLVGVPSAYFFAFVLNFEPIGIWAGLAIGLGFAAILLGFRFVYLTNSNRKKPL
jgi:MATE family multidrug resistance protein